MPENNSQSEEHKNYYAEFLETKFKLDVVQQDMTTLNNRLEHLEKVADKFEALQYDIKWIRYISQGIGAIVFFLFGDVFKKKLGL